MWNETRITEDLRELGLEAGANVLIHTSLRAIGPMEKGAETLLSALQTVLGPEGTLLVPTFTRAFFDPTDGSESPLLRDERERPVVSVFDPQTTPAEVNRVGNFPEWVRQKPNVRRSNHPGYSFAATGANAEFLTENVPFHYPLGSDSPLARLHQLNGQILLLGVSHTANTSLYLAEIWADVPYIHRSANVQTGPEAWTKMRGSPECNAGFGKIEPLLRQSRVLKRGYVGNAESQLMRQRQVVSMAVTMIRGDGAALLCNDAYCPRCQQARKATSEQY